MTNRMAMAMWMILFIFAAGQFVAVLLLVAPMPSNKVGVPEGCPALRYTLLRSADNLCHAPFTHFVQTSL